ncbi:Arsenate reductase and related proteins, glutaredoxin family [Morganella morganii]|nr:Arsenate reductase and related proteins, glutaredoxin family [Morganella morganii]
MTSAIRTSLVFSALMGASFVTAAAPLSLEVYNPGEKSIFPVSSEIISGKNEVVLIDAQFQKDDAQVLADKIRATGKTLTTIYISHSDPDFYFGLDELKKAFPQAKIVATPQTVALIKESKDGKLAYWGPVLKENAPQSIIVPEPLEGNRIMLEGESILIEGLNSPAPERSYVWGAVTVRSDGRRAGFREYPCLAGGYANPGIPSVLAAVAEKYAGQTSGHRGARPLCR